jgi:hypothetical protein
VRRTVKLTQGIPQDTAKRLQEGAGGHPGRRDPGDRPVARRAAGDHRLPPGPGLRARAQVWELPRLRRAAGARSRAGAGRSWARRRFWPWWWRAARRLRRRPDRPRSPLRRRGPVQRLRRRPPPGPPRRPRSRSSAWDSWSAPPP